MRLNPGDNIEKLFKSRFEDYTPDVDPKVWNNIQKSIKNSSHSGIKTFLGSLAGKFIIGTTAVTITGVATFLTINSNNNPIKNTNSNNSNPTLSQNITAHKENVSAPVSNNVPENGNLSADGSNASKNKTITESSKYPVNNNAEANNKMQANTSTGTGLTGVQNPQDNTSGNVQNTSTQEPQTFSSPSHPGMRNPIVVNGKNNQPVENNNGGTEEPVNNNPSEMPNNPLITKQPLANIAFTTSSSGGAYAPIAVYFTNKGKAASHEWNFGDGNSTSSLTSPSHIYEYPGEYTITLIATSESGRMEKDSIKLKILSSAFFIPNTFTPNGDGNNDVYKVMKNDNYPYEITNLEIVIFDRTSQKVGSFFSSDGSWDGRSIKTGQMCSQGSYLVIIRYTSSEDGKTHEQRGPLFLKE